jgi:glutamyl-Q tRNA(Asp) synthetase
VISRFAPSTTGEAHPGTLLSALLVWLDARSRGGRVLLRLEDLDTTRVKAEHAQQLRDACAFLGLDWDEVVVQSDRRAAHEAALDALAAAGQLYACSCSRTQRSGGRRSPDGGWAYPNTCRAHVVADWRKRETAIRVRLPEARVELVDELGVELSQTPALDMGDPVVVRKDGVIAYQLAVVVDDQDAGITDVIRGRDIAASTATQILLQRLLGFATPRYKHHFLLLEPAGEKLAKLHGSIPFTQLRQRYDARGLANALARLANLGEGMPRELLPDFTWSRVPREDVVVRWDHEL